MRNFILSAFVLLASAAGAQQSPDVAKALRQLDTEKPTQAIATLNQAISSNPTPSALYYYLGYVQLKTGDRAKAKESFEKGIGADPKQALNYVGKGWLDLQEKHMPEAKALFDKALTLTKSKDVTVLNAVGEAYTSSNQTAKDAVPLLEKSKGIDEKNPETAILLGDAYLAVNNGGASVTSYERAARLDPKNAKPHYKIGMVYLRSKNIPVAEEAFNKAIEVDPEYTLAYKQVGELYYLAKKAEKAVPAQENYIKLTEKKEEAEVRYAFYLFMAKDYPKAAASFEKLVAKPNPSPTAVKYLGATYVELKEYDKAYEVFQKYFAMKADQVEWTEYAYIGKVLLEQKKDSLAAINFQKALDLDSSQVDIRQLLVETFVKRKKWAEAVPQYRELEKWKKLNSQDLFRYGNALYNIENYAGADSVFTRLVEIQPAMTVSHTWQGRARAGLDGEEAKQGLAKPSYEKVIEVYNTLPPDKQATSKKDLIEAYEYIGYYWYVKSDLKQSKAAWEKLLTIDPTNEKAKAALEALAQAAAPPKPKKPQQK